MEKESELESLKKEYSVLRDKYDLPTFEELNEDFQIEKASESETDFILREIRKYIADKFSNYLRFIESIINPANAPMFVLSVIKTLGSEEREKLIGLYKKMSEMGIELIELDLKYSEEKEAESIKKYFDMWQGIKKELFEILEIVKKNWNNKTESEKGKYFG